VQDAIATYPASLREKVSNMIQTWRWMAGGFAALIAGACSVPLGRDSNGHVRELMLGSSWIDPPEGRVRRVVVGLDFGLGAPWRFFTVGLSDLRILEPRAERAHPISHDVASHCRLAAPLGIECRTSASGRLRIGLVSQIYTLHMLDTSFTHFEYVGASIRAVPGPQGGAGLGYGSVTLLQVPADSDLELNLIYDSRNFGHSQLILK